MDNQFSDIHSSEFRLFIVLAITLSLFLAISFIFGSRSQRKDISVPTEVVIKQFPELSLGAKAVYVYDARTKTVLFAQNEDTRLPLASLTKMMAALVAEDLSPLQNTITISREALGAEGDNGLLMEEKWSLHNLLDFSLVTSSNDAIRAVALSLGALSKTGASSEEIINDFVGKMNHKASSIGLKNTYFLNETGLDLSTEAGESSAKGGAYSTARDMNMLLEYILLNYPDLLVATREATSSIKSLDNRSHIARNTNINVNEIPGLLGSKTGFTDIAGGNIALVFDPELGRPIIIIVLGSTEMGRFEDTRILVSAIMGYIKDN